eukprot:g6234.t1
MFTKTFIALCAVSSVVCDSPIGAPCSPTATAFDIFPSADLSGKTALVTGSSTGIGLEVARVLATRKARVILTWRNRTRCLVVADEIRRTAGSTADLVCPALPLDLASFGTVRAFAKSLNRSFMPALDILVNDAAMANNPHGLMTEDSMEMAFQVDYPATWLLTELLLPQMRAAHSGARIVNLVSKAFRSACMMSERHNCLALDRLPPPVIPGESPNASVPIMHIPPTNYGIAKLLVVRWTEDLARREATAGTGVRAFSVDPGFVNTSMAGKANMSPFFFKLACTTESRKGAPCPTTAAQGALTPAFLAMAPDAYLPAAETGGYFEWCAPSKVSKCVGGPSTVAHCQLSTQAEQASLWNLTASWVRKFLDPADRPEPEPPAPAACPKLLAPLCNIFGKAQCFARCGPQASRCGANKVCRSALAQSMGCFVKAAATGKMASAGLACLVPDNAMRDDVFECLMDDNDCIPAPAGPTYPACRDTALPGDTNFTGLDELEGDWWKVRGWAQGEPYECRPCGRVSFGGKPTGAPAGRAVFINSSWLEQDAKGRVWPMMDSSYFGQRDGGIGWPAKLVHKGAMLGLHYQENFTVVHDGRHEVEPFMLLYGCGTTKSGAYTTGFALAQTRVASAALSARIAAVGAASGFGPDEWCIVNNTCTA